MDTDDDEDDSSVRPVSSGALPQRAGGPVFRASDLPGASRDMRPTVAHADEPIERSVNDVMDMRRGCEALARLTKQWEQGATPPWTLVTLDLTEPEHAAYSAFGFDLCVWSWALGKLMTPIAVAADQPATTALGSMYYVDVNANKLFCGDRETMHALHRGLNDDYFRLVDTHRVTYLSQLKLAAQGPRPLVAADRKAVQVLKCGQTFVHLPSPDPELLEALNAAYATRAQPALAAILTEIEDWASRG